MSQKKLYIILNLYQLTLHHAIWERFSWYKKPSLRNIFVRFWSYPFLLKFEFAKQDKKPAEIDVKEIYRKVWFQHLKCKKPLRCKSKSVEVTGLRSDVSQFPSLDEGNRMILTDKQKAVTENDFNERGRNAYKIWKEHRSFECSRMAVHNLI